MVFLLSRRQNLISAFAAVVTAVYRTGSRTARADASRASVLISQFTGGRAPIAGKVQLNFPDADLTIDPPTTANGNAVTIAVTVDSPMSDTSYVTDVLVVADGNTQPAVVTFHFTLESGSAEASTRIRLANTGASPQTVTAVAKMNDGSFYQVSKKVNVTGSGCG
jgi:sulfur-oxidizing protein SoxY